MKIQNFRMRMNDAAEVETVERLEGNSANYGRRQRICME